MTNFETDQQKLIDKYYLPKQKVKDAINIFEDMLSDNCGKAYYEFNYADIINNMRKELGLTEK